MSPDAIREPAFPGLGPSWAAGLAVDPSLHLTEDPRSPAHAEGVARIAASLGLKGVAWACQVHEAGVLRVEALGCAGDADALWTTTPGLGVMGRSADCPIVLIASSRADGAPVWGMAHASWRATVAGVVPKLLAAMVAAGAAPSSTSAWIAPSAGPCCYEVGPEVRAEALAALGPGAEAFFPPHGHRFIFDLWAAARDALLRGGVPTSAVRRDGRCTLCGEGFPSHRREGAAAGRFGVVLGHL